MTETDAFYGAGPSPAAVVTRLGQRAAAAGMRHLPDPDVPAYVSAGSGPRLDDVYPRVQRTQAYYRDRFGARGPVTLFFCDERDYAAVFGPDDGAAGGASVPALPYGVPWEGQDLPFLVLPSEHPPFAALWRDMWQIYPSAERQRLLGPCTTIAEATRLNLDCMAGHELGHLAMTGRGRVLRRWAHWLDELLATYLMRCALQHTDPSLWAFMEAWLDPMARIAEVRSLAPTTLADFEARYTGVGMESYAWYQGQFGQLAVRIFRDLGETFVDRIAAAFSEAPPVALAAPDRVGPHGLVVQRVAAIWSPIVAWSEAMAEVP